MTRALLAILVALTACCAWAATASADAAQVTVVFPGGATQTLALDALAGSEDVAGRTYALRSASGTSSQAVTGFSLARLLETAGADPYGFSYLEVQRPAGGAVLLSRDQALDPTAFADGPPVVYKTATGTAFLRPNASAEDLNADDSFEAPQGISIVLRKGTQLQVRAKVSATKVKIGQKVSFSVTVEGAGAGEQLDYSWYFDDGSRRTDGIAATHSFAKRGSYDVVVGVTTPGNDTGSSDVITIQVGAPVAGGPNRKGGGTNQSAGTPDHGAAEGSSTGTGLSTTSPAHSGEGPTPEPTQALPGEQVEGELISATTTMPPKDEQEQAAARTGNLDESGSAGGGGVPTVAAGLLATLGLLGLGALIEARRFPGRGGFLSLSESKTPQEGPR